MAKVRKRKGKESPQVRGKKKKKKTTTTTTTTTSKKQKGNGKEGQKRASLKMGGVAKYLCDLPSRGFFSSPTALSSNAGAIPVYICDHDTSPPGDQVIQTNTTNILIRSLQLSKQRSEVKAKTTSINTRSKRSTDKPTDGKSPAKKAKKSTDADGPSGFPADKELETFTVDRLRGLLREKGMSMKGKKDELISRLRLAGLN